MSIEDLVGRHRAQSRFSDPRRFAALLTPISPQPADLSTVARNVIVHYRASGHILPSDTRDDINLRWVERLLETDQDRHVAPLTVPRDATARAQGCCRDHTLLCVSALRAHGIPARSRVGFAGYFIAGWHHDHVIVEVWVGGQWQRFDPELGDPTPDVTTPTDMAWSSAQGRGFVSAANAWLAHRRGEIDPETFGVDPSIPVHRGPQFLFNEVIIEIAHRFGDELLLWDGWGRMGEPGTPVSDDDASWVDRVAELLAAADEGDSDAEHRVLEQYRRDDGLHPGTTVLQASPLSDDLMPVDISRPPAR